MHITTNSCTNIFILILALEGVEIGLNNIGYNQGPMHTATWLLPSVNAFGDRALTARRMRDMAHEYDKATHAVREHWYELPYQLRVEIVDFAEHFAMRRIRPKGVWGFLGVAAAPFSIAFDLIRGDDSFTRYIVALASFLVSVNERARAEVALGADRWNQIERQDPEFMALFRQGAEAIRRGENTEVDWRANVHSK